MFIAILCALCSPPRGISASFEQSFIENALNEVQEYFYYKDAQATGLKCAACPACMDCTTTPGSIRIVSGYGFAPRPGSEQQAVVVSQPDDGNQTSAPSADAIARLSPQTDVNALACPLPNSCLGETFDQTVWDSGSNQGSLCAEGYSGLLCAVCSEGYAMTKLGCEECDQSAVLIVPIILVVAIFVVVLYKVLHKVLSAGGEAYVQLIIEVERSIKPVFKVFITTAQILGSLPLTLGFSFSGDFAFIITFLRSFTLDMFAVLRLNCIFGGSFYGKFVVALLLPATLILSFIAFGMLHAMLNKDIPDPETMTPKQRKELRKEFEAICRRGSAEEGSNDSISSADLSSLCKDIDIEMTEKEIDAIIAKHDSGGDGVLEFDEFITVLHSGDAKFHEVTAHAWLFECAHPTPVINF